jgi:DNA-binding protein HU-beta
MAKARRTTHRSLKGKKLYAVRDTKGRFKDIQTYERAHGADIKRRARTEGVTKRKKARSKKKGASRTR